nr:STAS domain-containing protein [Kibdelosporangium phytohabitans]
MRWTVETGAQWTVVHLAGEIDMATQPDFDGALDEAAGTGSALVIVDLSAITFLASIGLRSLVRANRDVEQAGRAMRVVDGSSAVTRVMEISGLDQLLSIYHTVDHARLG